MLACCLFISMFVFYSPKMFTYFTQTYNYTYNFPSHVFNMWVLKVFAQCNKQSRKMYFSLTALHFSCLLFGKCLLVCLLKYPQHTGTGLKCLSKYDVIKLPPPTSTPNDDTVGKEGWGGENVSESDGVILGCSLITCVHLVTLLL